MVADAAFWRPALVGGLAVWWRGHVALSQQTWVQVWAVTTLRVTRRSPPLSSSPAQYESRGTDHKSRHRVKCVITLMARNLGNPSPLNDVLLLSPLYR